MSTVSGQVRQGEMMEPPQKMRGFLLLQLFVLHQMIRLNIFPEWPLISRIVAVPLLGINGIALYQK
jgi:hypothetical protein